MSHLIPSSLQHVFASDQASTSTIVATVLGTLLAVKLSSYVFSEKNPRKMIRGPATTVLPNLSQAEREKLPHPPDVYPGGRDVESPVRLWMYRLLQIFLKLCSFFMIEALRSRLKKDCINSGLVVGCK